MEWKYHFCADVQWPKNGATIAIVGYEDGGFVGTPDGAYKFAPPVQESGTFHFKTWFVVLTPEQPTVGLQLLPPSDSPPTKPDPTAVGR